MIQEEFVEFETAKLLKDAGFPQEGYDCAIYDELGYDWFHSEREPRIYAPTQSMAMRWLRDEKRMFVEISIGVSGGEWYRVWNRTNSLPYAMNVAPINAESYEAAAEAGIQAACKYLIKKKN